MSKITNASASTFIEKVKQKSNSYMSRNILRHASCHLQRGLYSYSGVYQREKMFSYLNTLSEERRSTERTGYGYDSYNDGLEGGIWGAYPFNCMALGATAQYAEIRGLLNGIADLYRHYELPYYENYISSLFSNIISGLSKGNINCKYLELSKTDVEEEVIKIDMKLKQKQVTDQWKPALEKLNQEKQMMLMGNRDKPQEVLQQLSAEYDEKIQQTQEQLNQQLSAIEQEYTDKFLNPLHLSEQQANLIVTKIGQEINGMLHDRYNVSELVSLLETYMTTGFGVMKLVYCEEKKKFIFRNVPRPETCFFSTITHKKNKADSQFCGEIWYIDKLLLAEKYNLTEDEIESIIDFPPVSNNYANFYLPFGADKKDYVILCDYYYKKDKKTYKITLSGDRILEESELKYFDGHLPLIYLDTSNPEQITSKSIFHSLFALQKAINDDMTQLQALINQLHGSKLVMGDQPEVVKDRMRREGWLKSPIIFVNAESGNNEVVTPTILPASELPQTLLLSIQDKRQHLIYLIQGIIQNNQFTKNSQSMGVASGVAIENADMNQENSYAYFLDEIKKEMTLSFQKIIVPNLFHIITRKDNISPNGIEKFMVEALKENGGETLYRRVCNNLKLEIEWIVDATMTRNRTNLLLKEIASLPDIDVSVRDVLIDEIILNSDLAGGGNMLVTKIQEAKEERAKQPPQPDPALMIAQGELELKKQGLELEAQKTQQVAMSDYEKLRLEYEKLLAGEKKDLRKDHIESFKASITHANNLNAHNLNMANAIAERADKFAEKAVKE